MDLHTITSMRRPQGREDLGLAQGEAILGGGSWLFSEPQDHLTGLVDLTALGWPALTMTDAGLSIAAHLHDGRTGDDAERARLGRASALPPEL